MGKLIRNIIVIMVCCLMAMSIASAEDKSSYIEIDPLVTLEIPVEDVGTFNVTLHTSVYDDGTMEYDTGNDFLHAQLVDSDGVSTTYGRTGSIAFTIPPGEDEVTFELNIMPVEGIVCHMPYDVELNFMTTTGTAKAMATASTIPIPELITLGLMSIGVLALLGLVIRQQRKD